jgi:hypothetical protein
MKNSLPIIGSLCLLSLIVYMCAFYSSQLASRKHLEENKKSFAIDSVDYHPPGKDNTLQFSPYWRCHLKGTNVWVRVNENKKVGDSLAMIIRYGKY